MRSAQQGLRIVSLFCNVILLSFRGAEGDEESCSAFVFSARFLATPGMTVIMRSVVTQTSEWATLRSTVHYLLSTALLSQPEYLVDQLHNRRLVGLTHAALKFGDGAMQDLVHHAAREGVHGLALLRGHVG